MADTTWHDLVNFIVLSSGRTASSLLVRDELVNLAIAFRYRFAKFVFGPDVNVLPSITKPFFMDFSSSKLLLKVVEYHWLPLRDEAPEWRMIAFALGISILTSLWFVAREPLNNFGGIAERYTALFM